MLNKSRHLRVPLGVMVVSSLFLMGLPASADTVAERLDDAAAVLSEVMSTPDKGIPKVPFGRCTLHNHRPRRQKSRVHRGR